MDIISQDDVNSKQDKSYISETFNVAPLVTSEKKGVQEASDAFMDFAIQAYKTNDEKVLFERFKQDMIKKDIGQGTYVNGFGQKIKFRMTRSEMRKRWMELQDPSLNETFTTSEVVKKGKRIYRIGS